MTLLELQRRMAADIMRPLTRSDHVAPEISADYIQPNDRLTSMERLEIYSRSYWFRLIDSMYEDFLGLRVLLGSRAFDRLVRAYLADRPSRSFTLRDLGSRLEGWLRNNPGYAGSQLPQALDMVRLEWAHLEAWDGMARKALGPEDLLELGPETRLTLQPHIRLVKMRFPVDELRLRVKSGEAWNFASTLRRRKPYSRFLAVHRLNLSVFYKILSPEEFSVLEAVRNRRTISNAIEGALSTSSRYSSDVEAWIGASFKTWAELGWLCSLTA